MMMVAVTPARAPDAGASCGRTDPDRPWRSEHSCHFWFRGLPLLVWGNAGGPQASVRVWISLHEDPAVGVPLVECSDQGGSSASCSEGLPDETGDYPWPTGARFLTLWCHVEGNPSGTYQCVSGLGS